jgi:hypothetical protein
VRYRVSSAACRSDLPRERFSPLALCCPEPMHGYVCTRGNRTFKSGEDSQGHRASEDAYKQHAADGEHHRHARKPFSEMPTEPDHPNPPLLGTHGARTDPPGSSRNLLDGAMPERPDFLALWRKLTWCHPVLERPLCLHPLSSAVRVQPVR